MNIERLERFDACPMERVRAAENDEVLASLPHIRPRSFHATAMSPLGPPSVTQRQGLHAYGTIRPVVASHGLQADRMPIDSALLFAGTATRELLEEALVDCHVTITLGEKSSDSRVLSLDNVTDFSGYLAKLPKHVFTAQNRTEL